LTAFLASCILCAWLCASVSIVSSLPVLWFSFCCSPVSLLSDYLSWTCLDMTFIYLPRTLPRQLFNKTVVFENTCRMDSSALPPISFHWTSQEPAQFRHESLFFLFMSILFFRCENGTCVCLDPSWGRHQTLPPLPLSDPVPRCPALGRARFRPAERAAPSRCA
jgi:hypothetical protein